MNGDTFHPLEEFGSFPWEKLNPQQAGIGYGGVHEDTPSGKFYNLNPREPSIAFVHDDISSDRWAIPDNLARLLEEYHARGKEEARQEIRQALQVDKGHY